MRNQTVLSSYVCVQPALNKHHKAKKETLHAWTWAIISIMSMIAFNIITYEETEKHSNTSMSIGKALALMAFYEHELGSYNL